MSDSENNKNEFMKSAIFYIVSLVATVSLFLMTEWLCDCTTLHKWYLGLGICLLLVLHMVFLFLNVPKKMFINLGICIAVIALIIVTFFFRTKRVFVAADYKSLPDLAKLRPTRTVYVFLGDPSVEAPAGETDLKKEDVKKGLDAAIEKGVKGNKSDDKNSYVLTIQKSEMSVTTDLDAKAIKTLYSIVKSERFTPIGEAVYVNFEGLGGLAKAAGTDAISAADMEKIIKEAGEKSDGKKDETGTTSTTPPPPK